MSEWDCPERRQKGFSLVLAAGTISIAAGASGSILGATSIGWATSSTLGSTTSGTGAISAAATTVSGQNFREIKFRFRQDFSERHDSDL